MNEYKFMWVGDGFDDRDKKASFRFGSMDYIIEDPIHLDDILPHLLRYSYSSPTLFNDIYKLYEHYGMPETHFADELVYNLESDPLKQLAPNELMFDLLCKHPVSFPNFNIEQAKAVQKIFLAVYNDKKKNNFEDMNTYLNRFAPVLKYFPSSFFKQQLDCPEIKDIIFGSFASQPEKFKNLLQQRNLPKKIDNLILFQDILIDPKVWNILLKHYPVNSICSFSLHFKKETLFHHFIKDINKYSQTHNTSVFTSEGTFKGLEPSVQEKLYKIPVNTYLQSIGSLIPIYSKQLGAIVSNHPNHLQIQPDFFTTILQNYLIVEPRGFKKSFVFELVDFFYEKNKPELINIFKTGFDQYIQTVVLKQKSSSSHEKIKKDVTEIEAYILNLLNSNYNSYKKLKL